MKKFLSYKIKPKSNNLKIQYEFIEGISQFLNQGYSLFETFKLLSSRYKLEHEFKMLNNGDYLSEILSAKGFDNDILLVIEIAEKSGFLKEGVQKGKVLLKHKIDNKNEILELIKYPLLLSVILIVSLIFLSSFLIPQFRNIYDSFDMELNTTTKLIFIVIENIPFLIILIIVVIISIILYIKNLKPSKRVEYLLKFKVSRGYYLSIHNQLFVINISNLLSMGLKLDEVLLILKNQTHNNLLCLEASRMLLELEKGEDFSKCVHTDMYFEELKLIINEGELNNSLEFNLKNYTNLIRENKKNKMMKIMFLIQPIFYLIFGVLIVLLYGSIFLPMFQMMEGF